MIKTEIYEQVLFETIKRGATEISPDVRNAFVKAIEREENPDAKKGLMATLDSMEMSKVRENPLCVDTGWPIFYYKVGNDCV
ncbi:MAG: fumarate hydratase [Clostridia bacterium]|nr:fumarate hydratase [Clostridia bacterium]